MLTLYWFHWPQFGRTGRPCWSCMKREAQGWQRAGSCCTDMLLTSYQASRHRWHGALRYSRWGSKSATPSNKHPWGYSYIVLFMYHYTHVVDVDYTLSGVHSVLLTNAISYMSNTTCSYHYLLQFSLLRCYQKLLMCVYTVCSFFQECDKKENDIHKTATHHRNAYNKQCKQIGIAGQNVSL